MLHINKSLLLLVLCLITINYSYATSVFINTDALSKKLNNKDLVIIDMSDATQYQRFHLPNAIFLPYSAINKRNNQKVSVSIGTESMIKLLSYIGISTSSDVVIYDDMGGLHGARFYWELQRLGHNKIALLDGGLTSWVLKGKKVTNKTVNPKKSNYQKSSSKTNTLLATQDDIRKAIDNPDIIILDVRSKEEYFGNPKNNRSGHIPGAIWWQWQQAVDFDNGFSQKKSTELLQSLKSSGITDKNKQVIVYCRSGHRASQTYVTLKNLGFNNVRLYDGSISDYEKNKISKFTQGANPK